MGIIVAIVSVIAIFGGALMKLFGFTYQSVGSIILFFVVSGILVFPIEMFVKAFPGVTVLPESVKQANAKGVPLVAAYAQYVANQRQVELQKIKQQQETASRAPVGGATKFGGVGQQAKDPFEEGFDEDSW